MKVTVYSLTSAEVTQKTLPAVFSVAETNPQAVAVAQRVYLANARQATAKTKTRSEVARTTKKVYKQKGTGGARHGSRRAPIFVGGGVTHGPVGNQNWSLSLPKQQRGRALQQAIALRADSVGVIDLTDNKGKTNVVGRALKRIAPDARKVAIVLGTADKAEVKVLRNLDGVQICTATQVNSRDIISADQILLTNAAIDELAARFGEKAKKAA